MNLEVIGVFLLGMCFMLIVLALCSFLFDRVKEKRRGNK